MKSAVDILTKGLEKLEIKYSRQQINSFITYLGELKKWNSAHNLTSLRTDEDIIIKHFLDSMLFCRELPVHAKTVADIGSGAGFPGVPVKIMKPQMRLSLIEPKLKKAVFLRHVCCKLNLKDVEVIDKRLENVSGLKVDVAMTRALFSIADFISKAKGNLNDGGILILSKGKKVHEELAGINAAGLTIKEYKLPFLNITRHIVVVRI